jgi:hypothetical protein
MLTTSNSTSRGLLRAVLAAAVVLCALAATAFSADRADAAEFSCQGRDYLYVGTLGTWNNSFGHRVTCSEPASATTTLWRWNGSWTIVRQFASDANTNTNPVASRPSYTNQRFASAPLSTGYYYVGVKVVPLSWRTSPIATAPPSVSYGHLYLLSANRSLRAAPGKLPGSRPRTAAPRVVAAR